MNPTLMEIGVAVFMVAALIALFAWFARYLRGSSEKRMVRMLTRAGVDPGIAARGDKRAIIEDVRRRCRKCQAEDQCERWLDGKAAGENTFCPNARIFRTLTTKEPAVA